MFLDSGEFFSLWRCFGLWEAFLDSGYCFWILGRCFSILEHVLDSGKCFGL